MAMWRKQLDPYVQVLPTFSSSVLPLLLSIPGLTPTAHVTVYLPTHGRDTEFISAMGVLDNCMEEINENFACPIYLRGDFNVNPKNLSRVSILKSFCTKFSLSSIDFGHPSHHHFMGNGASDAQLDLLLYSGPPGQAEIFSSITCSLINPLVNSHHDLIVSSLPLNFQPVLPEAENLVTAPKLPNTRVKVRWDDDGINAFEGLVSPSLARLRDQYQPTGSPTAFSLLLSATNTVLSEAAKSTNRVVDLSKQPKVKSSLHPDVKLAQAASLSAARTLRAATISPQSNPGAIAAASELASNARAEVRRLTRVWKNQVAAERDNMVSTILDHDPRRLFSFIRSKKSAAAANIQKLSVSEKVYTGSKVPDGFYDSLSSLKAPDMTSVHASSSYQSCHADYMHVLEICNAGVNIPPISGKDASLLLHSLRCDVNDIYSVTANHYINAGLEGSIHFTFLLNTIISNVNLSSVAELNTVWAMILFKGHGKDRESDRSYRTISTCPLIAKALDRYVGSLFESGWVSAQAETQFQGSGSSHELAALLLTETIQYSLYVDQQPVLVLLLDAQSAFDRILYETVIRAAYLAGSAGQGLIYLNNRLSNRKTCVEWEKTLMGPFQDELGVEQGGLLSDREYKLCNNSELKVTQNSQLGVDIGPVNISSVGQADDVALVSTCPFKLQGLLHLALEYAEFNHVKMVQEKTKLLCYTPRGSEQLTEYWRLAFPITMQGLRIPFSKEAEHVGILRSSNPGAVDSIIARISAHTKALHAVLPAGLARRHLSNPAASLRVHQLYLLPVLLSGLAALVLGKPELDALDHHHKVSLERLLRLYPRTPAPVVYLLAGSLPASGHLHCRQLGLFGMLARQGKTAILHRIATSILTNPVISYYASRHLWFLQVKRLCLQYALPDPLDILASPPSRSEWKRLVNRQVQTYWREKILAQAAALPSISHLRSTHLSLSSPSPLISLCKSSQHEIRKLTVQLRMLSGRYRTCWLRRHWSGNISGNCEVPGCSPGTPGTLAHIATGQCAGLTAATIAAAEQWANFISLNTYLLNLFRSVSVASQDNFLAFLLNPTTHPEVIGLAQQHGKRAMEDVSFLTRSWLYEHHRARYRALGLYSCL